MWRIIIYGIAPGTPNEPVRTAQSFNTVEQEVVTVDTRFSIPLYTYSTAARHLDISPSKIRYWANKERLITVLPPQATRSPRLPFIALVEAQLYCVFRKSGLSMQAIASGMKEVRERLGDAMLREGVLAHDGKDILMNLAKTSNAPAWTRAHDYQTTIPDIVDEGLRLITWGEDEYPQSILLSAYGSKDVVADYRFVSGQPIIKGTRVTVDDVIGYFKAGESIGTICDELVIGRTTVESIIRTHVNRAA